jgi:SAM-dependent methyltransferase
MTEFSRQLIDRSGYLDASFPPVYDRYRPAPSHEVLEVLTTVAGGSRPKLVVDLGSGTGLSTRAWADWSDAVVGVEANPQMVEQARRATPQPNVTYDEAYASETGLPEAAADLVTSFQAFHWMEPQPVLAEAARILRRGGVFAAVDYDVPPFVEPEVDEAFRAHFAARRAARQRLAIEAGAARWPKDTHVDRLAESGCFRFVRELVAHGRWELDADRLVGLAESIGGPRAIFGDQAPEVGETFARLCETAHRVLADEARPAILAFRLRIGIR